MKNQSCLWSALLKRTVLFLLAAGIAVLPGCKKEYSFEGGVTTTPTPPVPQPPAPVTTVYVCGWQSIPFSHKATLWTDGVPTSLTDGSNPAMALSVFVDGDDVYVAGFEQAGTIEKAKLWKNGVATDLSDGTQRAVANGVLVANGDVYVAGHEHNGLKYVARLWKNGVPADLTDGTNNAYLTNLCIAGQDVYCSGYERSGNKYIAKYWKNGQAVTLGNGQYETFATDIIVKDNDVYIAGTEITSIVGKPNKALFWKNGFVTGLTDGLTSVSGAASLCSLDNDVYICGREGNDLRMWKNGGIVTAYSSNPYVHATGLDVMSHDNDIYMAGRAYDGTKSFAMLWKNGVATPLTESSGSIGGEASAVFVVTR